MAVGAPTTLSSSLIRPLVTAIGEIYVEDTLAGLDETSHLGAKHKEQLSTLIRRGASPREIADAHFLDLHQNYVSTLLANDASLGISSYWTDLSALAYEKAAWSEESITVNQLRQHMSFTHPLADRVLAVSFNSPQGFMGLIPPHIPYSTFSFWVSLQEAWEAQGVHVLQSPDQYSGRLLIPSLSAIEAIVRCVDNPDLNLYVAAEEIEPELYKALWQQHWCPVALVLQRLLLPEVERVLDPPAYADHDLLHLVNRLTTSRNLGLSD